MADLGYAGRVLSVSYNKLGGGLNSTAGPLGLEDNEASELQNVDFDKFGSILQRNGYTCLNTSAITNTPNSDGLYWFEYDSSGTTTRFAINVADGKIFKMDALDGTWDDITGGLTITADNHCDFETFVNTLMVTNGTDPPWIWTGSGNATTMTVPTGLTDARFNCQFQNYAFLGNVQVSGTWHRSRFYWSDIKDITTWGSTHFIDVSVNDGQEITGLKVLGDRMIVFKTRSIHQVLFTGDRDIPFIVYKTNSSVGCVAPWTIQEVENGLMFVSYDGIYYFDGNNSVKVSNKINTTFLGLNRTKIEESVSLYQRDKNRYWLATANSGSSTNDLVIVWDSFNNAFSLYEAINASAMAIFVVNGVDERPYFGDYGGFVYRADDDSVADDYPSNTQTAIDSYYATNWKSYQDIVDQKRIPHTYIYYQINDTTMTIGYTYDFDLGSERNITLDMSTSQALWDVAVWDVDEWGTSGGAVKRKDLTGRGRVIRIKFSNNLLDQTWQIDGIGFRAGLETNR